MVAAKRAAASDCAALALSYAAIPTGYLLAGRKQEAIGLALLGVKVAAAVISGATRLGALWSHRAGQES
jgi:hypothetical protein